MFHRQTYYYHIITSAWGIEDWIKKNGPEQQQQQTSEGDQQQQHEQQQQQQQQLDGGRLTAASIEATFGDCSSEREAAIEDDSGGDDGQGGGRADNSLVPFGEGARGYFDFPRAPGNNLRESPWKLYSVHTRGCGTKRRHWHFIYISRSKQWGHNSSLGRIIRTGQHKCEGITCLACLVQYLFSGNGRQVLKNVLTRSDYEACKCAFHSVEGAHKRYGEAGHTFDAQGGAGALASQGHEQGCGIGRMDTSVGETSTVLHSDGGRGMEHEQEHSSLGEEPAPGTRRHGLDTGGSGRVNNFTNAKLVLLFCEEKCFSEGDGERVLSKTPEGIEYMFHHRAGERIKTAINIARILVFQETLNMRVRRCKLYQLKQDPEVANEEVIDRHLSVLVTILESNDIDVENFARQTFNHLIRNCGKRNNLFFYGPPSTGKTMIMESLVNLHFNFTRLTGLTPNSSFNFASLLNTNACFMDECKVTDNQFEQWKLLAAGSPMCTDVKYKERHNIENCVLYTSANHNIGTYIQAPEAHKAIETRTIQFNFVKSLNNYTPFSAFVWEKLWQNYNLRL